METIQHLMLTINMGATELDDMPLTVSKHASLEDIVKAAAKEFEVEPESFTSMVITWVIEPGVGA